MKATNTTEPANGIDLQHLVRLLAKWNEEIKGWEYAADIARHGGESAVSSRNNARAFSIRGCVDDLRQICETNANEYLPREKS